MSIHVIPLPDRRARATLAEAFVYHAAGLAGRGGSSYIDSVISRDAEKSFDWTGEGDDVLDERTFYLQNWRHDVVAIVDSEGLPIEEIRYTAYGTPMMHPIADVNHDGIVNAADATVWGQIQGGASATGVWSNDDLNRDELFPGDMDDDTFFYSRQTFASGSGYGFRAMSVIGSRKGYAGYEWDDCTTTWHVRHRVLDSESGKWTRMDPLGYVDGGNLVSYVLSSPVIGIDPLGLWTCDAPFIVGGSVVQSNQVNLPPFYFFGWEINVGASLEISRCYEKCSNSGLRYKYEGSYKIGGVVKAWAGIGWGIDQEAPGIGKIQGWFGARIVGEARVGAEGQLNWQVPCNGTDESRNRICAGVFFTISGEAGGSIRFIGEIFNWEVGITASISTNFECSICLICNSFGCEGDPSSSCRRAGGFDVSVTVCFGPACVKIYRGRL